MAKIILFVDALDEDDLGTTRFSDTLRGQVESGAPKVTPKVTSEVYTGTDPTNNGMGGQHSLDGERLPRPQVPTIMEKLEKAGYSVGTFFMPYCHPPQLQNQMFVSDTMQGPQTGENPLAQMAMVPPAPGDLVEPDDDGQFAFNSRVDEIYARSSLLLNTIRLSQLDVVFLGIRSPDQYTHFQHGEDYREQLVEDIAYEIERWEVNHDVFWWSDHGNESKDETFRINKWLMEKGYLSLDVDVDFHERLKEEMSQQAQQNTPEIENTLGIQEPGVEIQSDTQALSADGYDSSIDVVDDDLDPKELAADLESTGYYDRVVPTEQEWGNGQFRKSCPDLVGLRADNVLVTGNVHPEPIGMGYYRSGVHSKYGVWGTTDDSFERSGVVSPQELHDVIWHFVTGESQIQAEAEAAINRLEKQFEETMDITGKEGAANF